MNKRGNAVKTINIILVILLVLVAVYAWYGVIERYTSDTPTAGINDPLGDTSVGGGNGNVEDKASEGVIPPDIVIPETIQVIIKIAFGIKSSENVGISIMITLVMLWIIFCLLLLRILGYFSFFGKAMRIGIALFMMMIISITGGLLPLAFYLYSLIGLLDLISDIRINGFKDTIVLLKGAIFVTVIIIAMGVTRIFTKYLRKNAELQKASSEGFREGASREALNQSAEEL